MDSANKRLHNLLCHLQPNDAGIVVSPTSGTECNFKALQSSMIFNDEVRDAIHQNKPIVALESTVLSHGLPYPENLALANSLEDIVRAGGCVPCTIALLDGKIHFGLNSSEIERLALAGKKSSDGSSSGEKIHKASVRDLAWILSTGANGATTVAATSFLANLIGVRVFATGGIGGVHRDGHITMDVSADLVEMSRSNVIVVCAGAKSILDIPRTLEYLETLGVPVIGYRTDEFPAFFTRKSGVSVPLRLDSAKDIAKLMQSNLDLGIGRGVLVSVPISEKDEADAAIVDKAIQQALKEADEQKIVGRDITPFILGRVSKLSGGNSLKANIALLQQNATIAAMIAKEMAQLPNAAKRSGECPFKPNSMTCPFKPTQAKNNSGCPFKSASSASFSVSSSNGTNTSTIVVTQTNNSPTKNKCPFSSYSPRLHLSHSKHAVKAPSLIRASRGPVVVIGGMAVDILSTPEKSNNPNEEADLVGLSIPGRVIMTPGGVGRNIAEALAKFGLKTSIISALGGSSSTDVQLMPKEVNLDNLKVGVNDRTSTDNRTDSFGSFLLQQCAKKGIEVIPAINKSGRTAVYNALSFPNGRFRGGVADMSVLDSVTPQFIEANAAVLKEAKLVVVDANIPVETIHHSIALCGRFGVRVLFEATSAAKVIKLGQLWNQIKDENQKRNLFEKISFIKPNLSELETLAKTIDPKRFKEKDIDGSLNIVASTGIQCVVLTMGKNGAKIAFHQNNQVLIRTYAAEPCTIVDANGAGDSFAAGFIFGQLSGLDLHASMLLALRSARLTLESAESVSPLLSPNLLVDFQT